jgi:hypothetical protein
MACTRPSLPVIAALVTMKYIDLDSLPWYTKQQLAEHQLDRAIRLLLDEKDAISAVTLAGAAEEILGKLVELQGGTHSLKGFIDECLALGRLRQDEEWSPKSFADIANYFRNELKHYVQGSDIAVTPEAACDLIERAAENLWLLSGRG